MALYWSSRNRLTPMRLSYNEQNHFRFELVSMRKPYIRAMRWDTRASTKVDYDRETRQRYPRADFGYKWTRRPKRKGAKK